MSKALTFTEFIELRRRLTESYVPVSPRAIESWIGDWNIGLQRLHYARVGSFTVAEGLKALVKLRGAVYVRSPLFDMSRPDLAIIWNENVANGLRAYHAIDNLGDSYDFHFAALTPYNQYITGSLSVVRAEVL